MADLLFILAIFLVAWLFWLHRRASEIARHRAQQLCKQFNLQYVSLSLDSRKFSRVNRHWHLLSRYRLEFSPDGLRKYEGDVVLYGMRPGEYNLPPVPEENI